VAIVFLLPGFLALKSQSFVFPTIDKNFSKKIIEIFLYSCLHFLLVFPFFPVYGLIFSKQTSNLVLNIYTYLQLLAVTVIIPPLYPIATKFILKIGFIKRRIVFPVERPWEVFFSRREPTWVIIYLKSGRTIVGSFGDKSSASSSQGNEQIYLEKLYEMDENFIPKEVPGTKGGIFSKDCWEYIEFLEDMPNSGG